MFRGSFPLTSNMLPFILTLPLLPLPCLTLQALRYYHTLHCLVSLCPAALHYWVLPCLVGSSQKEESSDTEDAMQGQGEP